MSDLKLKKELFSLTKIFQSVNAFSEIADISVSEEADVYNCKFCACVYDKDDTIREFENYLIDLSYKNRQ